MPRYRARTPHDPLCYNTRHASDVAEDPTLLISQQGKDCSAKPPLGSGHMSLSSQKHRPPGHWKPLLQHQPSSTWLSCGHRKHPGSRYRAAMGLAMHQGKVSQRVRTRRVDNSLLEGSQDSVRVSIAAEQHLPLLQK